MKEALKLALEALTYIYTETTADEDELIDQAITALRLAIDVQNMASESTYKAALAQPAHVISEQEQWKQWIEMTNHYREKREYEPDAAQQAPTGMLHIDRLDKWLDASLKERKAQRTWVGLTDEEIQAVAKQARSKDHAVTLTNKLLKEKNNGLL